MSWGLVSAMGHVAIRTDRFEESVRDATETLGLRENARGPGVSYLSAGDTHHELRYLESDDNSVESIGLVAAGGDALRLLRRRVADEGLRVLRQDASGAGIADGFTFLGPDGIAFEVFVEMVSAGGRPTGYGPDRYGHVNLHVPDPRAMQRFLVRVLDFRVSDVIGDGFGYFLRCNTEHHGVAVLQGRGTLHHHAWQVQSIADLGKLGDRLHAQGRELIWGPVRHGAGHNIAAYYVAPAGNVVELYTDLEQIYDDDRPPIEWVNPGEWNNLWSRHMPPGFRDHGLAPALRR